MMTSQDCLEWEVGLIALFLSNSPSITASQSVLLCCPPPKICVYFPEEHIRFEKSASLPSLWLKHFTASALFPAQGLACYS